MINEVSKESKLPQCTFDCEVYGHICCRLRNGEEECRTKNNCPDPGKLVRLITFLLQKYEFI